LCTSSVMAEDSSSSPIKRTLQLRNNILWAFRATSSRKIACSSTPVSPCQNYRVLFHHRTLHVVRLSMIEADKCLLHRNRPLQHGFHRHIIGAAENAAHIDQIAAASNQWIYAHGVIPDHTPSRCFDPASKAAPAICNPQLIQIQIMPVLPDRQPCWQRRVAQQQPHVLILHKTPFQSNPFYSHASYRRDQGLCSSSCMFKQNASSQSRFPNSCSRAYRGRICCNMLPSGFNRHDSRNF